MKYYVNSNEQPTGEHEVHQAVGCPHPAEAQNQIDLGDFPNCEPAVQEAKRRFPQWEIDGCKWCSPACHTR